MDAAKGSIQVFSACAEVVPTRAIFWGLRRCILRVRGGSSQVNILEKRIDEVFSACAEVVPPLGHPGGLFTSILRVRGGSSARDE